MSEHDEAESTRGEKSGDPSSPPLKSIEGSSPPSPIDSSSSPLPIEARRSFDASRIEAIFADIVSLPSSERELALQKACAGDVHLLREVRSLFVADAKAKGFLETPPSSPAIAFAAFESDESDDTLLGARLGVYRIDRRLGAGGMSVVYLARRDDADIAQEVAVKVLKRGMDTEEVVARFRSERRLLATLEHPHIARFLDGGVTPDGRPYLVMERIHGAPMTEACERSELPRRERLRLFREACDAVHFAHQRLVVHRDLKPSNLLVTEDGHAKLLDFGIAKMLAPEDSDSGGTPTKTGTRLMTPRYASPEQLRGEGTTIATDIYSLGVVLREILEPIGALQGDLAVIVAKATHETISRRYDSVAAFAADLVRYETGFPISARPDTPTYRLSRLIRRNPILAALGTAVGLLLVAFAVTSRVQMSRIAKERDRANTEAETARETADFLENLFRVSDPNESRSAAVTARELLDAGAKRLETDLEKQPLVRGRLLKTIGRVQANLGLYDYSEPNLEKALALFRESGEDGILEAASSLDALANLLRLRGDTRGALASAEEALQLRERILEENDVRIAQSLNNIAVLKNRQGDLEGARTLLQRAIAIRESAPDVDKSGLAGPLHTLANVEAARGDSEAARRLFERSLALLEETYGPTHARLAAPLGSLAELASDAGRHAEAESLQRRAIAIDEGARGPEHDAVGAGLADLALVLKNAGRSDDALAPASRAVAILEKTLGPNHPNLASALFTLAQVQLQLGHPTQAGQNGQTALAIMERAFPPGHPALIEAQEAYEALANK